MIINFLESRNRVYECIYEDCRKIFNDKGSYRKHQLTHGEKQVNKISLLNNILVSLHASRMW